MKWWFSVNKASQRFLTSQRYHLHGGSHRRFFHALKPIGLSKPYQMVSSFLYSGHYYSTSTIQDASDSSYRLPNGNNKKVDLEMISRETIKPHSPTPHHLRTFKLSVIDQYMYDVYTPTILFLPNTNKDSVSDVLTKRSKHLKESLSKILTRFYPFAGKVKDNMQIECNDGLYYIEARVNETLEDFLRYVDDEDDERVRQLKPEKPCTEESSKGNYVIGIQVNIFKCGGIGLSTSTSHKIFDAHTIFILLKAWAEAARGSPEIVSPSFIASEIFPNKPCLKDAASPKILTTKMITTKRFVFDSSALATLKAQPVASGSSTRPPTRTVATTAVIWKAAAKAASKVRPFGPKSPHALFSVVDLRKRASPPLPNESSGNLIDLAGAICFPDGQLDLATMMGDLIDSMARINSDHIESLKGDNGQLFSETLKISNHLSGGDSLAATSVLNSGMYELDFGWGKPLWFYVMSSTNARGVTLNETLKMVVLKP